MENTVVKTEVSRVFDWRENQFLQQGFTPEQATTLAGLGVNHHDTRKIVDAGCSPDLAFQITT